MTTTVGQPERSQWRTGDLKDAFVRDAIEARGYTHYLGEDDPEPEPEVIPEPEQTAGNNRSKRSTGAAMTAIADALGVDVTELDDISLADAMAVIDNDLSDPLATMDAVERALAEGRPPDDYPKAAPGESSHAYRVREGNWRVAHGMPRKRKSVPPSRTPEARRARHIQTKAERLGISLADAEQMTAKRRARPR